MTLRPGLHRTSLYSEQTIQELEAEARRINADEIIVYLDDKDIVVSLLGLDRWGDLLAQRLQDAELLALSKKRSAAG